MGQGWEVERGRGERPGKIGHLGTCLRSPWYERKGKPVGAFALSCGSFVNWGCTFRHPQTLREWGFKIRELGLFAFHLPMLAGNLVIKSQICAKLHYEYPEQWGATPNGQGWDSTVTAAKRQYQQPHRNAGLAGLDSGWQANRRVHSEQSPFWNRRDFFFFLILGTKIKASLEQFYNSEKNWLF